MTCFAAGIEGVKYAHRTSESPGGYRYARGRENQSRNSIVPCRVIRALTEADSMRHRPHILADNSVLE